MMRFEKLLRPLNVKVDKIGGAGKPGDYRQVFTIEVDGVYDKTADDLAKAIANAILDNVPGQSRVRIKRRIECKKKWDKIFGICFSEYDFRRF